MKVVRELGLECREIIRFLSSVGLLRTARSFRSTEDSVGSTYDVLVVGRHAEHVKVTLYIIR